MLRRIYSAVQRGDSAELQTHLAHDVEWILPEAVPCGEFDIFTMDASGDNEDPITTTPASEFDPDWQQR